MTSAKTNQYLSKEPAACSTTSFPPLRARIDSTPGVLQMIDKKYPASGRGDLLMLIFSGITEITHSSFRRKQI